MGDSCDDCLDVDGDGFGNPGDAACPGGSMRDCNDLNPAVFPGARELCNNMDDDCSGATDDALCDDFDVTGDSQVDGVELAWLGRAFGECSTAPASEWWFGIDYTADGCVDGNDLAVLATAHGCSAGEAMCN